MISYDFRQLVFLLIYRFPEIPYRFHRFPYQIDQIRSSEVKKVKKVSGDSLLISSISLPKAIKSGVKKIKEVKKVKKVKTRILSLSQDWVGQGTAKEAQPAQQPRQAPNSLRIKEIL